MSDIQPTDPQHTALLVMDYQPAVLHSLADPEPLLSRVTEAIALVRGKGAQIGHVRVAFDDEDYARVPAHSRMAPMVEAAGLALHSDAPTTAFHRLVEPASSDIVVRKTRVGAFSTTDLGELLDERSITTLILAGISTSGVVLSTVRDAHDRDYQIFVLSDATADPDPEVHRFLTEKIFPKQAHVITTADLDGLFSMTGTIS